MNDKITLEFDIVFFLAKLKWQDDSGTFLLKNWKSTKCFDLWSRDQDYIFYHYDLTSVNFEKLTG